MGGLLRLLLLAIAIWLIISGVRRLLLPSSLPHRNKEEGKEQEGLFLVQDPQCGRFVFGRDTVRASFHGQGRHFCSQECRDLYTRPHATEGQEKMVVTFLGRTLITTLRQARRLVVIVVGFMVLFIGIAMMVLPGPAVVVVPHWPGHSGHGICLGRVVAQSHEADGRTDRIGVFWESQRPPAMSKRRAKTLSPVVRIWRT